MTAEEKMAAEAKAAEAKAAEAKAAEAKAATDQNKEPVVVIGDSELGGPFNIIGPGLGAVGTLTIDGRPIVTTRWDDRSIRGELPVGISGAVVLVTETGTRHGVFPSKNK